MIPDLHVSEGAAFAMAGTALGMVLMPGPNMIYLVSRSLSQGRVAGLISLLGTGTGFVVYLLTASFGLAMIFVLVPWLYIGFKAAGVTYLAYLTVRTFSSRRRGPFSLDRVPHDNRLKLFTNGLVTNILNPKAAVMYLVLIPQYIRPTAGSVTTQGLVLGGIQISVSLTVNAMIILASGSTARMLVRHPRWGRWQRRVSGTLLGAVTVTLALEVPQRARV